MPCLEAEPESWQTGGGPSPLEGDAPSAPIFPARQRGLVSLMGAGLRPARVGRHGGRPSKGIAASGRLVSRAAGQTEADGGEAEVRVSEVAAAGESAVVRMLVQLPPRMRWS